MEMGGRAEDLKIDVFFLFFFCRWQVCYVWSVGNVRGFKEGGILSMQDRYGVGTGWEDGVSVWGVIKQAVRAFKGGYFLLIYFYFFWGGWWFCKNTQLTCAKPAVFRFYPVQ